MDVSEMQKRLSKTAEREPEHVFDDLYSLLGNVVWLRVAHHHVNTNQGRETAGIDGESMSHFNGDLDGNLARLTTLLKTGTFEPVPVRRTYTAREAIIREKLFVLESLWSGYEPRHTRMDIRKEVIARKGTICDEWTRL